MAWIAKLAPRSLAGYGIALDDLRGALQAADRIRDHIGITAENREILVQAGSFLTDLAQIGDLSPRCAGVADSTRRGFSAGP